MDEGIRLHLGCGTKHKDGWVNVDSVEACCPDLTHDLSKPLPFADRTVDEILAEDLLEHFDKYLRFLVFYEWTRVLKINGSATIQVPNFKKILFKYFKFGYDNFVDFLFGENMWQSKFYIGHFGNHKWGYSEKTLKEFVELFGIETVKIKTIGLNIRLEGIKKRHVAFAELEGHKIYSHANKFGDGKEDVSVGFAKEKIQEFQRETLGQEA